MADDTTGTKRDNWRIPKPNVIKIRPLNGAQRARYLGGIQTIANDLKELTYTRTTNYDSLVFFGFAKGTSNQGITISPKWATDQSGGGLLSSVKDLASQVLDPGGGAAKVYENAGKLMNDLTGISSSVTGSGSLKRFGAVDISGLTVQCGWYLPDMIEQCRAGLAVLSRLAYPMQADVSTLKGALNDVIGKIGDAANTLIPGNSDEKAGAEAHNGLMASMAKSMGGAAIDGVYAMNKAFGNNFTIDPLPVRLMIGHYMDIEPMVVDSVAVTFSKGTYRAKDGRDYPMFCDATISLSFWLNPAPKLEFMKLLGVEMFGPTADAKMATMGKQMTDLRNPKVGK